MSREMKDSGIPWIGEIPKEWRIDKVVRLFNNIGSGTTPKSTEDTNFNGTYSGLNVSMLKGRLSGIWYKGNFLYFCKKVI